MADKQVESFLKHVHGLLKGMRAAKASYAPRFAPDFNALRLLEPDENHLSVIIAELLKPSGRHGQGKLFWELFLKAMSLGEGFDGFVPKDVEIEARTDRRAGSGSRRIDILATDGGGVRALAIENKPWATDQAGQVRDYLAYLDGKKFDHYVLVYLQGDGNPPSEDSISLDERKKAEDEGHLVVRSYEDLMSWLQQCLFQCPAPRVSDFLRQFVEYIEFEFRGISDMTETSAIVDAAINSPDNVRVAMEIVNAGKEIRERLCKKLQDDLHVAIGRSGLNSVVSLIFQDRWWEARRGFSFFLNSESDRYALEFQFFNKGFETFFLGFKEAVGNEENLSSVCEVLRAGELDQGTKPADGFFWWRNLENPSVFTHWGRYAEPWEQIATGKLAETIIGLVEKIRDALKDGGVLANLK
jgi:hypothetical protein